MLRLWKKWIILPITWLVVMAIPLGWSAAVHATGLDKPSVTQSMMFTISSFDATYDVSRDTAAPRPRLRMQVTEKIDVDFHVTDAHGILRTLPLTYGRHAWDVVDVSVTDSVGARRAWTSSKEKDNLVLRIGNPSTFAGEHETYVVRYTVTSAMVGSPEDQEVYLDVNGTGWAQDTTRTRATLRLGPELQGALTGSMACYQGDAGSTQRCQIARQANGTVVASTGPLSSLQTMTIAVGFAPHTVEDTVGRPHGAWWERGLVLLPALVGLVALLVALVLRFLRRRPAGAFDAVPPEFRPPMGLEPVLAADLVGRPEKGVAALLTDLVVRGQADVVDAEPDAEQASAREALGLGGASLRSRLRVRLHDLSSEGRTTRRVATAVFGDDDGALHALREPSDAVRALLARQRREELLRRGWASSLRLSPLLWIAGWLALLVAGLAAVLVGAGNLWVLVGSGMLGCLLVVLATHLAPATARLTQDGAALRRQLLGLERFVTMADGERAAVLENVSDAPREPNQRGEWTLRLMEPLLPYAIIFGVEDSWRRAVGSLGSSLDELPTLDPHLLDVLTSRELAGIASWHDQGGQDSFFATRQPVVESAVAATAGAVWSGITSSSSGGGGSRWSGGSSSSSSGSSGGGSAGGGAGGGGGGGW